MYDAQAGELPELLGNGNVVCVETETSAGTEAVKLVLKT